MYNYCKDYRHWMYATKLFEQSTSFLRYLSGLEVINQWM